MCGGGRGGGNKKEEEVGYEDEEKGKRKDRKLRHFDKCVSISLDLHGDAIRPRVTARTF